ncbi:MAG: hypothetical protein D6712_07350 [Chloroflexi bacterium]|nr:MAG: hypothetical protein D6712_07350 [Chloroflexota bacterium]
MSTANNGNPKPPVEQIDEATLPQRRLPWGYLTFGILGLAVGIYVLTQVLGVLYGIVFPPTPPLPDVDLTELRHESDSYGVDEWLYGTQADACRVLRYYQSQGATCTYNQDVCAQIDFSAETPGQNVGRCVGEDEFSIFAMRWEVNIAGGYVQELPTQFSLKREVFWTGAIPPEVNLQSP